MKRHAAISGGEISYYVYLNQKKTPMLTVGTVKEMSHANYPQESWTTYDGFPVPVFEKSGRHASLHGE